MDLMSILSRVELFDGLTEDELRSVSQVCRQETFQAGDVITRQGTPGDEIYVICEGLVEVVRGATGEDIAPRTYVRLGRGQLFGEMALVDHGPRSATVRSVSDGTVVQVIKNDAFEDLCEANHHMGYIVMRNMAADLSFKLRHRNLSGR
jgi:CRP-like cAMP-binding protein